MRLPYPERISYTWATVAAAVLLIVQLVQHTGPAFAFYCFAYVLIATTAFNLAGGLYRPAGAYIFFNAVLTLLIGLMVKAFLGEAADSNLLAPIRTIQVYLLGMMGILVAAYIETRFRPVRGFVAKAFPVTSLRSLYLGAAVIGLALDLYWLSGPTIRGGTVLSALHNADRLLPFAVILGVLHTVRSSGGKRSITPFILFLIAFTMFEGMLSFTKQGLLEPFLGYLIGVGIARYNMKPISWVGLAVMSFIVFYFGITVVQVGKGKITGSAIANIPATMDLIMNFGATRAEFKQTTAGNYGAVNYFNHPEGIFDRLEMISIDDLLINETDRDGFFGYEPFKEGWENLIPHFIWKDKPVPYFGNVYAHQLGLLSDNDPMTGVSFSASADAYKEGGFAGVLLMEPFCFIMIFLAFSFAAGDLREHPAVIFMVLVVAHAGPEGAIPGAIQLIILLVVMIGFAVFCRYIAPVVTSAVIPSPARPLGQLASTID